MISHNRTHGFTIIELMVVIGVITILLTLVTPAVLQHRESARQQKCTKNLKELGLALHNYESGYNQFPPSTINPGAFTSDQFVKPGQVRNTTGYLSLLPYLGQDLVPRYNQVNFHLATDNADWHNSGRSAELAPQGPFEKPIDLLRCPADTEYDEPHTYQPQNMYTINNAWRVSYGFVSHTTDDEMSMSLPAGGSMFGQYNYGGKIADVYDGTANTIMIMETPFKKSNPAFGPFFHAYVHSHYVVPTESGINQPYANVDGEWVPNAWGAGSQHEGGCNILLGDGNVRFLNEYVGQTILTRLVIQRDRYGFNPVPEISTAAFRLIEFTKETNENDLGDPPRLPKMLSTIRSNKSIPLGEVSGVVTLDGAPLPNAAVKFLPPDSRMSIGITDDKGKYELRFNRKDMGAVIGKHRVEINFRGNDFAKGNRDQLPEKYNLKSELTATVNAEPNEIHFDLRSR